MDDEKIIIICLMLVIIVLAWQISITMNELDEAEDQLLQKNTQLFYEQVGFPEDQRMCISNKIRLGG